MISTTNTYKFTAKVFRRANFVDIANIFGSQNLKIKEVAAFKKHEICGCEDA